MKKLFGNKKNLIIAICAILIIVAIVIAIVLINKKGTNVTEETRNEDPFIPKVTVVDVNSKSRPYAVMINNHPTARLHHAGLQDAYIIYEMIVEGGMTRYMALFKDQKTDKIGSVRSARHYFLDYALENDAYYVHWGWSPQAQSDISSLKVNNINGLYYEGTYFYRDRTLEISNEHRGFTKMDMLNKAVSKLGYRTETNKDLLLSYTTDEVDLSKIEDAQKADQVVIKYSNSVEDTYTYDSENKYYLRSVNGKAHVDDVTKQQYHFKNIITYQVENYTLTDVENKGRQGLNNIGSGEGYYITNGYAIKIKWTKKSREEQTKYTYLDGTPINMSDGNTFIQIQPKTQNLVIKGEDTNGSVQ